MACERPNRLLPMGTVPLQNSSAVDTARPLSYDRGNLRELCRPDRETASVLKEREW